MYVEFQIWWTVISELLELLRYKIINYKFIKKDSKKKRETMIMRFSHVFQEAVQTHYCLNNAS